MSALKKLKNKGGAKIKPESKLTIPIPNQLMKIIRQCEVYLMEEAITDQIIRTTQMQIDPNLHHVQTGEDVLDQSDKNTSIIDIHTNIPPKIVEQDEAEAPHYQDAYRNQHRREKSNNYNDMANNRNHDYDHEPEMRTEKGKFHPINRKNFDQDAEMTTEQAKFSNNKNIISDREHEIGTENQKFSSMQQKGQSDQEQEKKTEQRKFQNTKKNKSEKEPEMKTEKQNYPIGKKFQSDRNEPEMKTEKGTHPNSKKIKTETAKNEPESNTEKGNYPLNNKYEKRSESNHQPNNKRRDTKDVHEIQKGIYEHRMMGGDDTSDYMQVHHKVIHETNEKSSRESDYNQAAQQKVQLEHKNLYEQEDSDQVYSVHPKVMQEKFDASSKESAQNQYANQKVLMEKPYMSSKDSDYYQVNQKLMHEKAEMTSKESDYYQMHHKVATEKPDVSSKESGYNQANPKLLQEKMIDMSSKESSYKQVYHKVQKENLDMSSKEGSGYQQVNPKLHQEKGEISSKESGYQKANQKLHQERHDISSKDSDVHQVYQNQKVFKEKQDNQSMQSEPKLFEHKVHPEKTNDTPTKDSGYQQVKHKVVSEKVDVSSRESDYKQNANHKFVQDKTNDISSKESDYQQRALHKVIQENANESSRESEYKGKALQKVMHEKVQESSREQSEYRGIVQQKVVKEKTNDVSSRDSFDNKKFAHQKVTHEKIQDISNESNHKANQPMGIQENHDNQSRDFDVSEQSKAIHKFVGEHHLSSKEHTNPSQGAYKAFQDKQSCQDRYSQESQGDVKHYINIKTNVYSQKDVESNNPSSMANNVLQFIKSENPQYSNVINHTTNSHYTQGIQQQESVSHADINDKATSNFSHSNVIHGEAQPHSKYNATSNADHDQVMGNESQLRSQHHQTEGGFKQKHAVASKAEIESKAKDTSKASQQSKFTKDEHVSKSQITSKASQSINNLKSESSKLSKGKQTVNASQNQNALKTESSKLSKGNNTSKASENNQGLRTESMMSRGKETENKSQKQEQNLRNEILIEDKQKETPRAENNQKLAKGLNINEPYHIQPNEYVSLTKQVIIGWQMKESHFISQSGPIYSYLNRISQTQKECFGGKTEMIRKAQEGYDLHVMAMVEENMIEQPNFDNILGLVIFSQESGPLKNDTGKSAIRVVIHHVSSVYEQQRNAIFDLSLEYIWKHTHCCSIRINMYHFSLEGGIPRVDEVFQQFLKVRGFRWKSLQNDSNNKKYTAYEISNHDFPNQMRKSQAIVFRRGFNKEDLLREPISVFFSTMIAFGKPKNEIDQRSVRAPLTTQLQSQANIVQNLFIINQKLHSKDDSIKFEDLPKLSNSKQDVKQGYISEIYKAVCRHYEQNEDKIKVCLLPRTKHEYEKSKQIAKVKAIRGISPRKDISVKLPESSEVLLVTKMYYDTRFKCVNQARLEINNKFSYFLRIKQENMLYGSSANFKQIIIIPSFTGEATLFILIPNSSGEATKGRIQKMETERITVANMHSKIKAELNEIQLDNFKSIQRVWLPQFKIGKSSRDNLQKNELILGYKVNIEGEDKPLQVVDYMEQQAFQLFAMPISDSNLIYEPNSYYNDNLSPEANEDLIYGDKADLKKLKIHELLVSEKEFFIAMTHDNIQQSIDLPLFVAQVTEADWKLVDESSTVPGTIGTINIIGGSSMD